MFCRAQRGFRNPHTIAYNECVAAQTLSKTSAKRRCFDIQAPAMAGNMLQGIVDSPGRENVVSIVLVF